MRTASGVDGNLVGDREHKEYEKELNVCKAGNGAVAESGGG